MELVRLLPAAAVLTIGACAAPADVPAAERSPRAEGGAPSDDGTYLTRIDPVGGQWRVERIGAEDVAVHKGWVNFSAGGVLNHGAGCGGGFPAFYRINGGRLSVTRAEQAGTGKCMAAPAAARTAAEDGERRLTAFIDRATTWSRPDRETLLLGSSDGTRAVLTRPREADPEIAGRWIIQSIGGEPFVTERRVPTVAIGLRTIGAHADCNSMGGPFLAPAPGRITVSGPIVSQGIGCTPEDAAEDELMSRALRSSNGYRVQGDRLSISGDPGMLLRRSPMPDRRLAGEYRSCGNMLPGGRQKGPVTLIIDDRSMRDNAGCTATYTADGPYLTLRLRRSPACAHKAPPSRPGVPVGIGGTISPLAIAPPDGFGFDDQGVLNLRTSRGLLSLCRRASRPPFGS